MKLSERRLRWLYFEDEGLGGLTLLALLFGLLAVGGIALLRKNGCQFILSIATCCG